MSKNTHRVGLNGIMVYKADRVSIQNLTACNFLNGPGASPCNQVYKEFGGTSCNTGTQTVSGCVNGTLSAAGSGSGSGSPYTVTVSCDFQLLTPFMSRIVGAQGNNNRVTIRSNATFMID